MISTETLRDILWGIVFVIIQVVLIRHLRIFEINADIIWVYVLWLATNRDRLYTVLLTSALALLQDSLLDIWGLNLFTKASVIFVLYRFLPRSTETRLLTFQIFTIILLTSLLHNFVFMSTANVFDVFNTNIFFSKVVFGNSLYTAFVGSFIYLFSSNQTGS